MAEPILKWAGGKRQLVPQLKARIPKKYNNYHEPMFGAGALFFELKPVGGTVNDINDRLINFHRQVKENPEELIEKCQSFKPPTSEPDPDEEFSETDRKGNQVENYYYQQRALFNRRPNDEEFDPVEEAALLLYLNRTCYNGLYRENNDGEFNVPIGDFTNPDWVREEQIMEASKVLADVDIRKGDFSYILDQVEENDLVYFDPPYQPMSATANFTQYDQDGFGREDQERLLEIALELIEKGAYVIISNSAVTADMYEDAGLRVEIVEAKRAINSDPDNRDEVEEVIVTNIEPEQRRAEFQKSLQPFA